jgi:hypothetical protein
MDKASVLRVLRSFSHGEVPFEEFENWVLSHLQGALDSGDPEAAALVNESDALLLRLGQGEIDDGQFADRIAGLVRIAETLRVVFSSAPAELELDSGSDAQSILRNADFTGSTPAVRLSLLFG